MKKLFLLLTLSLIFSAWTAPLTAVADTPVKREMRSAWVATVWRLDWPQTVVTGTGNESQIKKQQQEMTTLLDSLSVNNFNAINFQIRSRCDAMYKSSYEPWSADLVSERGLDPGWDPLEWIVEECHKRGMECHAWVNPYRYESVSNQWDGTPKCYRESHPEWILDVNGASILNPARQDVIDQIVRVIREVVQNYDVDGVLFDDYFYLSGTPTGSNGDGDQYAEYKEKGGTLSQADWRRENVNRMVKSVYDMIQEEKPWVRFGVSPAGIACTSSTVARKYGISPCPTGSDWQYSSIFSDPIAWLYEKSIDFISPQIYWTIGNSTDYDAAAKWWSEVADHFGRHFYSSHDIATLTSSSTASPLSIAEQNIAMPMATGPNSTNYTEYSNQVKLNREYTLNDAPGSIFYSCKYLYRSSPKFGHHLKNTVFTTPALVPAITYKPGNNPGQVKNLAMDSETLTWDGYDNVRYTVYAVPNIVPVENFDKNAEYLLGTSYSTSYAVPKDRLAGFRFAVCVLDRYGNEYSPVFLGQDLEPMDAPQLISPADGDDVEAPFVFKWTAVENATAYAFEISSTADFSNPVSTQILYTNEVSTTVLGLLPMNTTLYWRVRSMGNGYMDGISEGRSFTVSQLLISSPVDGASEVSLTPTIRWSPSRNVTVEISELEDFSRIDFSASASRGSYTVPAGYLSAYTSYYLRLSYDKDGEKCVTPTVSFLTGGAEMVVPAITSPADGGEFDADSEITVSRVSGHTYITVELAASSSFPSRTKFTQKLYPGEYSINASDVKISNKALVEGTTYYLRTKATYRNEDGTTSDTEFSPVVTAKYIESAGVGGIEADNGGVSLAGNTLTLAETSDVEVYDMAGAIVSVISNARGEVVLPSLQPGVYVIRVAGATLKYISK